MDIVTLFVTLIIVGVLLYLINAFVPMDSKIKKILNIVVVIILIIWILQSTGVFGHIGSVYIK